MIRLQHPTTLIIFRTIRNLSSSHLKILSPYKREKIYVIYNNEYAILSFEIYGMPFLFFFIFLFIVTTLYVYKLLNVDN